MALAVFLSVLFNIGVNNIMGFKYIDSGIIYVPVGVDATKEEVDKLIANYKSTSKTIVLLRSGKQDIKPTLTELIKTRMRT